jgi:hypothetical protein
MGIPSMSVQTRRWYSDQGELSSSEEDYGGSFKDEFGEGKVDRKYGIVIEQPYSMIGILRKIVGASEVEKEGDLQRENIFYLRCRIKQKSYSMNIDGGSCKNVISATLVEKLEVRP